jgi:hypothetical protein
MPATLSLGSWQFIMLEIKKHAKKASDLLLVAPSARVLRCKQAPVKMKHLEQL